MNATLLRAHCLRALPAALAALCLPLPALADLMLYPTRLTLDGAQRAAQVEIVNRGQRPESYRIHLVSRRMSDTGQIVPADAPLPDEQLALDMLRHSPRQVTLQPGESQTVRVQVRRPAGLADGEYRAHLQFDRQPDPEGSADLEQAGQAGPGQIAVRLTALVGASIPVIVRQGSTHAAVTLDELVLEPPAPGLPDAPLLRFRMQRSGNRSVYGNLTLRYTPPGGQPVEVGRVQGVAVYLPNAQRLARLPLRLPDGMALRGGMLQLRYDQRPEDGGQPLAQASLVLPAMP